MKWRLIESLTLLLFGTVLLAGACADTLTKDSEMRQLFEHGNQLAKSGDMRSAAEEFERCLDLDENHANSRHNLGYCLLEMGDLEGARRELEELLRRHPDHAPGHTSLGVCHLRDGRVEEAIESFTAALEIAPDYEWARENLNAVLLSIANIESMLTPLPNSTEKRVAKLEKYVDEDRFTEAYADATRLKERTHRVAELLTELAIKCIQTQRLVEAEKVARIVYECDNGQSLGDFVLGACRRLQGRTEEAVKLLHRAYLACPGDFSPAIEYGLACQARGGSSDLIEAEKAFLHSCSLRPEDPRPHILLGFLHKDQGSYDEAKASFRRALSLQEDLLFAWAGLGSVFSKEGNHFDGEQCFRKALELNPNYDEARLNLGIELWHLGNYREGYKCVRAALASTDALVRDRAREILAKMRETLQ